MTQVGSTETGTAERPWLTLTEAAIRTGRHIDALRAMARRGKLEKRRGNQGQWLVRLPESGNEAGRGNDSGTDHLAADIASGNQSSALANAPVADSGMTEAVSELREEVAELRMALARAETKVESVTALAKVEVEAAK